MSKRVAIVGGGPAGLRAAEVIAASGRFEVDLYEGTRSVGRKFLVAGTSGLNLTNSCPFPEFLQVYHDVPAWWPELFTSFTNEDLRAWAKELGVETYAASSGKVFPTEMKAAPLLRRLVERIKGLGVTVHTQHYWRDFTPLARERKTRLHFKERPSPPPYDAVVFALGGGSWQKTGSDGAWVTPFRAHGIEVRSLSAANCGWETCWPPELLEKAEGQAVKNIVLTAGDVSRQGELVITRYGLEGGPLYHLGSALRSLENPAVFLDLKPTFTPAQLLGKMESAKRNLPAEAAQRWKLSTAQSALLFSQYRSEHARDPAELTPVDLPALVQFVKKVPVRFTGPRPLHEAISSAGGVEWSELNTDLTLKAYPGLYCAGEMLNWDAPTGGYLLQAAFSTGTRAGEAIKKHLG